MYICSCVYTCRDLPALYKNVCIHACLHRLSVCSRQYYYVHVCIWIMYMYVCIWSEAEQFLC